MNRKTLFSIGSALLAVGVMSVAGYGCGDDDDTPVTVKPDAALPETSTPETSLPDTGPPANPPPTLGAQLDRFGRPAVNTALTAAFLDTDAVAATKKNAYNADSNQAGWVAAHKAEIGTNLAILDSLDSNCGNQAASSQDAAAQNSNQGRYGTLSTVLADDRQWLNTAGNTAGQYLAVEFNALGITNTDRGGRTFAYDVIATTYSAVAAGAATVIPPFFDDGVVKVDAKTDGTTFPYLAAAQ